MNGGGSSKAGLKLLKIKKNFYIWDIGEILRGSIMNENNENHGKQSRRDFIKTAAAAGLGAAIGSKIITGCSTKGLTKPPVEFTARPIETVRIGFVGIGGMGSVHVRNLLNIEGVRMKALCDIVPEKVERARKWVLDAGQPEPTGYTRGDWDFKRMCETEDLDLVFTATPWRWHVPVCVAAMENGKHAATEVPATITLDECWQIVETSERTRKYCVMMENCCYDRSEMQIFNMVRQGLLGEIIHGECGYLHDLRGVKFSDRGEGLWRLAHSIKRDANLYPTHGLGPVAWAMDINRGDRFDYLVSMSTKSIGLNLYAAKRFGKDDSRATQKYKLGDVNVTLIRTKKDKTITLYHDCSSPRPYSRINIIQGTKGIAEKYPDRIYIEGLSEKGHTWEELKKYREQYEHPLWRANLNKDFGLGHGGMDYLEDFRLIKCMREGKPLDLDVYDAAAWSAVIELSEISVANKSKPVDFPDFTRGAWKNRPPIGIVEP